MIKLTTDNAKSILALAILCSVSTKAIAEETPTYSREVAPILQEKCASCHNPEGIGPMPLLNYDQVKPFASLIKDRTSKRIMPPWHLDPTVGIQQFKNDASLSVSNRNHGAWVDASAPQAIRPTYHYRLSFPLAQSGG